MTDAAHLLTDFGSILLSLFSLWISKKPASKSLTYGWHRSGWTVLLAEVYCFIDYDYFTGIKTFRSINFIFLTRFKSF